MRGLPFGRVKGLGTGYIVFGASGVTLGKLLKAAPDSYGYGFHPAPDYLRISCFKFPKHCRIRAACLCGRDSISTGDDVSIQRPCQLFHAAGNVNRVADDSIFETIFVADVAQNH
tara:strand:+ start:2310 stop:2654 length:345 start_codon:yes stop_codon:yes gene_type:complete